MSKNVETTHGKLAGEEVAGVHVFRGVPFARPPVGALRFAPPQPPPRWRGVRDALRSGAAPLQVGAAWMTRMRLDVGGRVDEDCLYLNVYTPALGPARRLVLVFLHGGAFLMGAGSTALYDSRRLVRRSDIVAVTTNYRLGALGWAHLGLLPGSSLPEALNLGLLDQVAALVWVRDNIAAFGGDPENVTLCGQSAGVMSAAALCTSPQARPLFRCAIVQSAAGNSVIGREEGANIARIFLAELGLRPETAHELRDASSARLLKAQASAWRRTYNPLRSNARGRARVLVPVRVATARGRRDHRRMSRAGAALHVRLDPDSARALAHGSLDVGAAPLADHAARLGQLRAPGQSVSRRPAGRGRATSRSCAPPCCSVAMRTSWTRRSKPSDACSNHGQWVPAPRRDRVVPCIL